MHPTPAQAYWNQRHILNQRRHRILALSDAVARPGDLSLTQWAQLMAYALEFAPDLIVELGRGKGNSTCAFTEVAHWLGPGRCRVLSLCLSDSWEVETLPRLRDIVSSDWLAPLEALRTDILTFDFSHALSRAKKVLVFWDAHGFNVAEFVLGVLLPGLATRPHVVIMHDLCDARYYPSLAPYASAPLWKGEASAGPYFHLGHIVSHVAQAVSIVDFTSRNRLTLHSADDSYVREFLGQKAAERWISEGPLVGHPIDPDTIRRQLGPDADKLLEMHTILGEQLFSLWGMWFWFSLNEAKGQLTYPRFTPPGKMPEPEPLKPDPRIGELEVELLSCKVELLSCKNLICHYEQSTAELIRQVEHFKARVLALTNSRWRKLGQWLGIARKMAWEKTPLQV
jgi:hypothetical protein